VSSGSQLPHILIVDDEPRAVQLMVRTLRSVGRVHTADNAEDGWKAVRDGEIDLVISDQRMPGTTGVELLTRVAEHDETIGRILLTGYTDLSSIVDAINLGRVHAYLKKPCDPDDVVARVEAVLARVAHARARERLLARVEKMKAGRLGDDD
jgi:DNA-binding NtrC family response regulator